MGCQRELHKTRRVWCSENPLLKVPEKSLVEGTENPLFEGAENPLLKVLI